MNPHCPHCQHTHTVKVGKTSAGTQQYRCKECAKKFIDAVPLPKGAKAKGVKVMTSAERQRLWYANLSAEDRAAYMAKKVEKRRELRAKKKFQKILDT